MKAQIIAVLSLLLLIEPHWRLNISYTNANISVWQSLRTATCSWIPQAARIASQLQSPANQRKVDMRFLQRTLQTCKLVLKGLTYLDISELEITERRCET